MEIGKISKSISSDISKRVTPATIDTRPLQPSQPLLQNPQNLPQLLTPHQNLQSPLALPLPLAPSFLSLLQYLFQNLINFFTLRCYLGHH